MKTFDKDRFLEWLDEQETPIPIDDVEKEFPKFPSQKLAGVTCPIGDNGELLYYEVDLRDVVLRGRVLD